MNWAVSPTAPLGIYTTSFFFSVYYVPFSSGLVTPAGRLRAKIRAGVAADETEGRAERNLAGKTGAWKCGIPRGGTRRGRRITVIVDALPHPERGLSGVNAVRGCHARQQDRLRSGVDVRCGLEARRSRREPYLRDFRGCGERTIGADRNGDLARPGHLHGGRS